MMGTEYCRQWVAAAAILFVIGGCKKKPGELAQAPPVVGPGAAAVTAMRDALTRGMQPISFDKLAQTHIGKRCVVVAHSVPVPPPPPPLGMVRILGSITLYTGELNHISPDGIKVRAAYPSSGNYKYVEIARTDIESLHISE